MSMHLLLGDFGGYMGLFLGGSAVSLLEIVDWLCHKAALRRRAKRRRRSAKREQSRLQLIRSQKLLGLTRPTLI